MPHTEPAGVYRPRHPDRTVVYGLFEENFERYLREYEERYGAREWSLRKIVTIAFARRPRAGPAASAHLSSPLESSTVPPDEPAPSDQLTAAAR